MKHSESTRSDEKFCAVRFGVNLVCASWYANQRWLARCYSTKGDVDVHLEDVSRLHGRVVEF